MRVKTCERPPTAKAIERIVQFGPSERDKNDRRNFLRRLWQSCYLDSECQALEPRQRLLAQYRQDGLVLFLGAGVSCKSRIPSWHSLAQSVLHEAGIATEYRLLQQVFPSLLTQFELAACNLGSRREFISKLYKCLYEQLECKPDLEKIPKKRSKQPKWTGWASVSDKLAKNKTLKTVGDLLIVDDEGKPTRNPQVHAVLTVNADNLLELYLT